MNFSSLTILLVCVSSFIALRETRAAEIPIGNWLEWSPWTACSADVYCSTGLRQRQRHCERGKRCVGIEEEAEGCPKESCQERPIFQDALYSGDHSFIQEECSTPVKYYIQGKYSHLLKHNITGMFPKARDIIINSFFNVKFTKKELASEQNIFKYCFEPEGKPLTLREFTWLFSTGPLRFKYTTIYRPLPKKQEERHVTGFVIGVQEMGDLYAIYAQMTTKNGFLTMHYKHMPGRDPAVRKLFW